MHRLVGIALLLVSLAVPLAAEPPVALGFVRLAAGNLDTAPSFLDGGFGKLLDGARPAGESAGGLAAEARLALDWKPGLGWRFFLHGVARHDEAADDSASGSGLLEAFVERRGGFGDGHEVVARLGQFFLPGSRENVDPLWTSPYTLTLSALNSWVAEEIRPIGLDLAWRRTFADEQRVELAATLFGGNDTAGTLAAWRGFSFHDRPTPTGRTVPLPPFPGRAERFPRQASEGTRPFGGDLDGRPGYAGRARWDAPGGRALVQATLFLNDGDRALHGDEYAWDTDFRWLGAEIELTEGLRLVGEWGTGTTLMGFAPPGGRSAAEVDVRYDLFYLLATWRRGPLRATVRFDDFAVEDRDSNPLDDNRESGRAWTFALLGELGERWRAGVEYLVLEARRPAAGDAPLDADAFRAELRWALF